MAIPEIIEVDKYNTELIFNDVDNHVVITQENVSDVITVDQTPEVITACTQGPPGPPGPEGVAGGQIIQIPAGEDLLAYRVVIAVNGYAYYADKDVSGNRDRIIGITSEDCLLGDISDVYITGAVTNVSWNFVDGITYLGNQGNLTQTLPPTGFQIQIGRTITNTILLIDIDRVIEDHDQFGGTF